MTFATARLSALPSHPDTKPILVKAVQLGVEAETKEIIHWLTPVHPALQHRRFREDYQQGTGCWIFDTPEYLAWTNTQSSALWIYGAPGAGKTILASSIIEHLSASQPSGFVYFYIRHNDADSQQPVHILGSLAAQLCQQNPNALREAIEFHESYNSTGESPRRPTATELGILLQRLSIHFDSVTIVVDGLDEMEASPEIDLTELLRVITTVRQDSSNFKIIVSSRHADHLEHHLSNFTQMPVAARSSDLLLYIDANLKKLHLNNVELEREVSESLLNNADGVFFWTVCQLQLLRTISDQDTIRAALKSLPRGLPATFCRILERIDAEHPTQIQHFVQRSLNWLAWGPPGLRMEEFVHMVCMHDEIQDLQQEDVPSLEDVQEWLGCLVRMNGGILELAHNSIKEFLVGSHDVSSQSSISNPNIQKYLMPEAEKFGPALACFSYLSLPSLTQLSLDFTDTAATEAFTKKFPFYRHSANHVAEHVAIYDQTNESSQIQRLFNNSDPRCLYLWIQYIDSCRNGEAPSGKDQARRESFGDPSERTSPLHVACELRLHKTVSRLLSEGSDPNLQFGQHQTPLHLAVDPTSNDPLCYNGSAHLYPPFKHAEDSRVIKIITHLMDAKADVNFRSRYADSRMIGRRSKHHSYCSPLYLAIWYRLEHVCKVLLDYEALLIGELPSLRRLAANFELDPKKDNCEAWVAIFHRVLKQGIYEPGVQAILKALKVKATHCKLENPTWSELCGPEKVAVPMSPGPAVLMHKMSEEFILATKRFDLDLVTKFMAKGIDLSPRSKRHRNRSARIISYQHENSLDRLRYSHSSWAEHLDLSVQDIAGKNGLMGNAGYAELFHALFNQYGLMGQNGHSKDSQSMVKPAPMMKSPEKSGASLAASYRGGNRAHHAMANADLGTFEDLHSQGVDIDAEDCVGERPLHIAIHQNFEAGIDFIIRKELLVDTINRASDHCGTPLYCAAKEGNIDAVEKLVCAGAFVNAVVLPGNTLGPALYVACAEGHARLVRVLLSHGADMWLRTSRYENAMEVAKAFGQEEVLEVLKNFGVCEVIAQ